MARRAISFAIFKGKTVTIRRKWFFWVTSFLLALFLSIALWHTYTGSGEDILRRDQPQGAVESPSILTGQPLFVFGNLYLDGRGIWLRERFQGDRRGLISRSIPDAPVISPKVHRKPFTEGSWVGQLDDELARQRQETETHTVETEVICFLPAVKPRHLLFAVSAAGLQMEIEKDDTFQRQTFFPPLTSPPADLDELPSLGTHQFLTREKCRQPLAMPTDIYLLNEVGRDDEVYYLVYEAWRNVGDDSHANVRLSSGQLALTQRDGGTLVHLHNYYSGQKIPPLMERLVEGMTTTFYEKLVRSLKTAAPTWKPSQPEQAWISRLSDDARLKAES